MGDAKMSSRFSIHHRGPAKGPDYEAWRDGICRGFCRLDVEPAAGEDIDCHNDFALMHCIAMATPKGTSARFARTRELLSDGCDDLVLISALRGTVHVTQGSTTLDLPAGQMCLTEMNVVGAADLDRTGGFKTIRFPRRLLLEVSPSAETQLARPLGRNRSLSDMINRYFELCNDVIDDLDVLSQKAAAQHLIDLVGLLIRSDSETDWSDVAPASSRVRLNLLKADILKSLHKSDLTIDVMARANGLSERQAQRLFAHTGSTFSEFVLEQRLLLARRFVTEASGQLRRISDIAYAAGFNDLSYFSRSFRRRFGTTASEMQVDARAGLPIAASTGRAADP